MSAAYWMSNVEHKQRTLTNLFGFCIVFASITMIFAFVFGSFAVEDIAFAPLLLLSVVGAYPYVEIAIKKNNKSSLTGKNVKQLLQDEANYAILSSRIAVMQPIYTSLCVLSFLLMATHKIAGETYVSKKVVLAFLIVQLPLNPLLGFNPVTALLRMPESDFVTHANLRRSPEQDNSTFKMRVRSNNNILNKPVGTSFGNNSEKQQNNTTRARNAKENTPQNNANNFIRRLKTTNNRQANR